MPVYRISDIIYRVHLKGIILFLVILFSPGKAFAESDEIERMILRGLDHCYNFRWDQGEEIFQKIIKKYSDDPRGYHFQSTIYLWYYLSTNDQTDYNLFLKYSNLAIEKSESLIDKKKSTPKIKYILGKNYSSRAMIFARAGNYLDAIWASKSSESLLKEVIKSDPRFYDAYLGLGLYNFAIGQIPSAFKWALNLAGISGDEKTGITYISNTAEKGTYSMVEAQYYLSQILSEVKFDYAGAGFYLKKLAHKYPDNLLFNYSLGVLEIKKRNLSQAQKHIKQILKAENSKFKQLNAFSNFLMGDILFRKNEFADASAYYREFISTANDRDYTGIANYRLAVCLEMLDERNNAAYYFSRSLKGNTDLEDDIYAKRKGSIYIERAMSDTEKSLVRFSNMIENAMYNEAMDSLKNLLLNSQPEKIEAEIYYYLSEAAFYSGMYEESYGFALTAAEFNPGDEKWIVPFSKYNAARASLKTGEPDTAKKLSEQVKDHGSYDYENKLGNLLETLH